MGLGAETYKGDGSVLFSMDRPFAKILRLTRLEGGTRSIVGGATIGPRWFAPFAAVDGGAIRGYRLAFFRDYVTPGWVPAFTPVLMLDSGAVTGYWPNVFCLDPTPLGPPRPFVDIGGWIVELIL